MNIKQEETDIKVSTRFTFQSDGNQDIDDSVPLIGFQKSNQKHGLIEDEFRSIGSHVNLETGDETLMDIKQEEIDVKADVSTTFTFQSDSDRDVDDSVHSIGFQKSNQKRRMIEDDFQSIGSGIKLETEDETMMDIKQEEININDDIPTTFTFQSDGTLDIDSVPSISFPISNQKRGGIEDDLFRSIGSNIKLETEDEALMNIKQEKIQIKCEVPTTFTFQSDDDQDVSDNEPSVRFQKLNQKCVSSHKTHREKLFVCNVCEYKNAYKANLTKHMKKHTEEKPFGCGLCDYKCVWKSHLTAHIRIHTGEKPFACDLCDFKSAQKANLTIHIRSHTGEKPFACDLCNFKSAHKTSLTIHIRKHTGEKPFACHLCNFKSAYKGSLTIHMRNHKGEKPFACDLCDFKSAQKAKLTIHKRSHTGEKPFSCGLCDFRAAAKSTLVLHMNRRIH